MSFMYKSMGAQHSNWQLSQNNQYDSYAFLSLGAVYNTYFKIIGNPLCLFPTYKKKRTFMSMTRTSLYSL